MFFGNPKLDKLEDFLTQFIELISGKRNVLTLPPVEGSDRVSMLLRELEKVLCIKPGETTENKMYSIEALRCVGACGLAPVIMVNDEVYGKVTVDDIPKILAKYAD